MIKLQSKRQQQIQKLFNGKFTENKPIPFPSFEKNYGYSNLFYWAHLVAYETGEFPLHPHEGFEIMTFVLKGSVEHYDTATNKWTPIQEGGFQLIQAGTGVMHSERIKKGSELFQVWFDPDFSKSLRQSAGYQDYGPNDLYFYEEGGIKVFEYIGIRNKVLHQTPDIDIARELINKGVFLKKLQDSKVYSIYVIDGEGIIDSKSVCKDDFLIIYEIEEITLKTESFMELFIVISPKNLPYKRYIDR